MLRNLFLLSLRRGYFYNITLYSPLILYPLIKLWISAILESEQLIKTMKKLIIFASGEKEPDKGGSGFKKLVEATRTGILDVKIVAVVSNHPNGGVFSKAQELGVPFVHSPRGRTANDYRRIVAESCADFTALSGWLGFVQGLDPRTTFNIHPAFDLRKFGGKDFYGHKVHEAVIAAFKRSEVAYSGVTMHFATAKYDDPGAIFFQRKVSIYPDDDADTLAERVNRMEHEWQARITNDVVHGKIHWDGLDPKSICGADLE